MHIPLIWAWRLLLVGFAVAYLTSARLQLWVPPLVPFLAAGLVEAQFFVAGLRHREPRVVRDHGPQARDLADFGWTDEEEENELDRSPPPTRPSPVLRRLILAASV